MQVLLPHLISTMARKEVLVRDIEVLTTEGADVIIIIVRMTLRHAAATPEAPPPKTPPCANKKKPGGQISKRDAWTSKSGIALGEYALY
jgi:hypothetical protein